MQVSVPGYGANALIPHGELPNLSIETFDHINRNKVTYHTIIVTKTEPSASNKSGTTTKNVISIINIPDNDVRKGNFIIHENFPYIYSGDVDYFVHYFRQADRADSRNVNSIKKNSDVIASIAIPVSAQGFEILPALDQNDMEPYCRCVLDVLTKLPQSCLDSGEGCVNPYAICAHSTKTTSRTCGLKDNVKSLSRNQLVRYAHINNIAVNPRDTEDQIRETILATKRI
jgi:hypothetical protein